MSRLKKTNSKGVKEIFVQSALAGAETGAGEPAGFVVSESPVSGTPYTQTELALNTIKELVFDPPIKGCSIEVVHGEGSAALDNDEAALFCFDPPSAAVAAAWLDEANTAPRKIVKPADGVRDFYFNGATVSSIWMIGKGTTPDMDVTIEGVV